MIIFKDMVQDAPYLYFKKKYNEALNADQKNIEAISISSYSNSLKEVNSRFVNLKYVKNMEFIFFSNYNSPKANEFSEHNQITAVIYWNSTNLQIRLKANIHKMTKDFNNVYFQSRSPKKNALAISSNQSKPIDSYSQVKENYNKSLINDDLKKCPDYWGGYSFIPYYFEFWEGHESRINKREVFDKIDGVWKHSFLQP